MNKKGIYHSELEKVEKRLVQKALTDSFGNQIIAAKLLGVNRNTLRSKIKRFNIDVARFKI